jgi:hypothetical protein
MRATQSLTHGFRRIIGAQAVPTPQVDPHLVRLAFVERSAEVLRYTLWRAEHWLSPDGTLRAVLRLSLKLALLIGIPVLIIGPVVLLLLQGAATASAALDTIAVNPCGDNLLTHRSGPRPRRAGCSRADTLPPPQEITKTTCGLRAGCACACPTLAHRYPAACHSDGAEGFLLSIFGVRITAGACGLSMPPLRHAFP